MSNPSSLDKTCFLCFPEDQADFVWAGRILGCRIVDKTAKGHNAVVNAGEVSAIVEGPSGCSVLHLAGGGLIRTHAAFSELYPHFVCFWRANGR